MKKDIIILGSTGSIGVSALRAISSFKDEFRVVGLTCKRNIEILGKQIREFNPIYIAVEDEDVIQTEAYLTLKKQNPSIEFFEKEEGVIEVAGKRSETVISAIVGAAGLKPSLNAIKGTKRIALANKETLVMAGDLFMNEVKSRGVELIPVDSEHSAIFSLLKNVKKDEIDKIILTASGGSLRDVAIDELHNISPERALLHPTWDMGDKITIDSATLVNKGLEVIEAHHLFNTDYCNIDVIIHPESVIHSMIETIDGSVYAHMGVADMALPILNALFYPEKRDIPFGKLDLRKLGTISFKEFDKERYPALEICYRAGEAGGTVPAVLNGANEIAVENFLKKKIKFTDIIKVIKKTVSLHKKIDKPSIEDIFNADKESRELSESIIRGNKL